jgi:Uma2 family endonuclease
MVTTFLVSGSMIAHACNGSRIRRNRRMHMALKTRRWTRADLQQLPDDGNTYEVVDGELLVTPAPSDVHQEIVDRLSEVLRPFVATHGLGRVQHPRSVVAIGESQVEPDLMVRPAGPLRGWVNAPLPILVIEVISRTTQRRDLNEKRLFYMDNGIPEYWAVDRYSRCVMRFTAGREERVDSVLTWRPAETPATLAIDLAALFADTGR